MSKEQSQVFLELCFEEKLNEQKFATHLINEISKFPIGRIFIGQIEALNYVELIDNCTKAFLMYLIVTDKNVVPAYVDLYVVALGLIIDEIGAVTFTDLAYRFASGFPCDSELMKAWDDLKLYRMQKRDASA